MVFGPTSLVGVNGVCLGIGRGNMVSRIVQTFLHRRKNRKGFVIISLQLGKVTAGKCENNFCNDQKTKQEDRIFFFNFEMDRSDGDMKGILMSFGFFGFFDCFALLGAGQ